MTFVCVKWINLNLNFQKAKNEHIFKYTEKENSEDVKLTIKNPAILRKFIAIKENW